MYNNSQINLAIKSLVGPITLLFDSSRSRQQVLRSLLGDEHLIDEDVTINQTITNEYNILLLLSNALAKELSLSLSILNKIDNSSTSLSDNNKNDKDDPDSLNIDNSKVYKGKPESIDDSGLTPEQRVSAYVHIYLYYLYY